MLETVRDFLWGPVMLVFLLGTGIFLMVRLRFLPLRNLWFAIKQVFSAPRGKGSGDISSFQSLMTSLATTIGTGNIVGVSAVLFAGGPGALFWMWISAILGMATKYAEGVLGVKYRVKNKDGEMAGGPMYAMRRGIRPKALGMFLAVLFSVFTILSSFGMGNLTQANAIAGAMDETFQISAWFTGLCVAILTGLIILGGIKTVGAVSGKIVPIMALLYIGGALALIIIRRAHLLPGLAAIFKGAFALRPIAGGVAGFTMSHAIRFGMARGVFSNEAGLGQAGIAAAAAKTDHPSRQGYIIMTANFFDTIIICTMTGLAVACSGVMENPYIIGATAAIKAFSTVLGPVGGYIVSVGLVLFAFSSIIGSSYYGEKALEFLVSSKKAIIFYRIVFVLLAFFGCILSVDFVWTLSDIANGLMAIPNLICLVLLSRVVVKETMQFQRKYIDKR